MQEKDDEFQIIDQIYATAIEPERFDELVELWYEKITAANETDYKTYPGDEGRLNSLMKRADTILSLTMKDEENLSAPLFDRLNSEPRPAFAIDHAFKIKALNAPAKHYFGIDENGSATDWLEHIGDDGDLRSSILRLFAGDTDGPSRYADLVRVWNEERDEQLLLSVSAWTTPSGQRFAIVRSSNFVWSSRLDEIFSTAFDLTRAETDIIRLIVEGGSVQDVANARKSNVATVRSQIKSIYSKTGTRNQTEFLRMTLGVATLGFRSEFGDADASETQERQYEIAWPFPEHMRQLRLSDGRILEYADCGDQGGRPVLYFHNDLLANIWPQQAAAQTTLHGHRLIIPSRPFYGGSSPYPKHSTNYEQTVADTLELLEHLGLDKVMLLSTSNGGMYALAMLLMHPELCSGHVAFAPAFAVETSAEEKQMPVFYRFMNSIVTRYPGVLERFLKFGTAYYRRVGPKKYLHRILGDVEPDMKIVANPRNLKAMTRALEFNTAHGHLGVFNDYRTLLPDSNERLKELKKKLFVIIGDEDRNSRMTRTDRMIEAGVNIKKIVAKGGGSLLPYSHAKLICETIDLAWSEHT